MNADFGPSPYSNYAYACLTANALRTPDRIALTYRGGPGLTYAELDRRVNRRANALLSAGVKAGQRVASLLNKTIGVAEVYLAEIKIGAVVAALNPYWDDDVLTQVVAKSGCTAFVYDGDADDLVARIAPGLPGITTWLRVGGGDGRGADLDALGAHAGDAEPPLGAFGNDVAALFYTSGTTGLPKAVAHTHLSCLATAHLWLDLPHDDDSVFGTGAIIWGVGFTAIAGPALYAGMRLVLEDDWGPANVLTVAPRERVTHMSVIPSFFAQMFGENAHEGADLSALRVLVLGGEPIAPSLLERIKLRLPDAGVYCYYGQTEAPYSCMGRLDDGSQDLRSVGRARTGVAVRVTDPHGRRVVGEVGELNLTGPHMMAGYDGEPGLTAQAVRDGWYVGGDLGRVDADGFVYVLGRRADAIVKSGRWTQPVQIEEVALTLDGVAEAGAVGVPEDADEQRILLAVSPRAGASLNAGALRAELAARLPDHQRPDAVVIAAELPHTQDASGGRGKLLRRDLRTRYADHLDTPT
ncbi:MAG TPA: class I adenylate-forming enzyme family protein [Streptosporangiaceae bacterium]